MNIRNIRYSGNEVVGIGRAVTPELASLKFNLIMHARTAEELEPVRDAIHQQNPDAEVVPLIQDTGLKVDWPQLLSQVMDLNVTVLVNNVGTSPPLPFDTLDKGTDDQIDIIPSFVIAELNTVIVHPYPPNRIPVTFSLGDYYGLSGEIFTHVTCMYR